MKFRVPQVLLCLSFLMLSLSITHAQQTITITQPGTAAPQASPTATAPAPAPVPLDQKAYDEARRVKDPRKKIEALEKVIKDFPDRFPAYQARYDVLDILIKSFPNEKDQIHAAAERILAPNQGIVVMGNSPYINVATKLMDAGLFLDWAEELAKKGSAQYEEEQAKAMHRQRARYQDALGRIYLKQGKTKLAKTFLKQAIGNDPELTTALLGLAQIAEQQGDHKAAVEFFSSAAVKGPLKKGDRQQMEAAYRSSHHGDLTGLEDLLDEKYRKLNETGLRLDHYQAPTGGTKRTALAELFTGSGCGPCIAADLGFDAMLGRYSRQELVVLVYHLHIPLPDPMTNPITEARGKYYAVPGTPTPVVDGLKLPSAGGSRDMAKGFYDRVNPKIEKELESPAEAELKLTGTVEGDHVKTRVTVQGIKGASPDLKLQLALTEDELRYTGENGIRFHPMVVRSLGGKEGLGFSLAASGPTEVEWTFDLKAMSDELKKYLETYEQKGHRGGEPFTFSEKKFQIDANNLSLVAFVQDVKTKAVLQTVYLKIKPAATASAQTGQK